MARAGIHWQTGRWRLLAGAASAVTALGATLAAPAGAAAPSAFSPAWYAQRSAQTSGAAAGAPPPIGISAAQQQQIDASRANLSRAADALRSIRTLQAAAQTAAHAASFVRPDNRVVTDGLGRSSLYFARGAAAGDTYDVTTSAARSGAPAANGLVWQGAELPAQKANTDIVIATTTTGTGDTAVTTPTGRLVETAAAGNTLVTVKQTQSKAILTWQNFDVGAHTTLYFQQTGADGTPQRDWIALNRVLAGAPGADGARVQAAPSLILGKIRGDGEVYVVNQNGVIFGAGSQTNANTVLASALDVGLPFQGLAERNAYFLTNASGRNNFSFQYLLETDPEKIRLYGRLKLVLSDDPNSRFDTIVRVNNRNLTQRHYAATLAEDAVEGGVVVEWGAQIATGTLKPDGSPTGLTSNDTNLGRIVLAAPTVSNGGSLRSDDGQVILVGARNYSLYANDGLSGKPIDPGVRGALVEAGQQDLTAVAVATGTGPARANPYITRNLATTIFGNYAEGSPPPLTLPDGRAVPRPIVGIAQGGENYNRDQLNAAGFPETDEARKFEIQFDSKRRPYIVVPTFFDLPGLATTYAGSVVNTGLVSAPRGSIVARANRIAQNGVAHATTSVNQAGLIDLKASNVSSVVLTPNLGVLVTNWRNLLGAVDFGSGAVSTVLPDDQVQADGSQKTIPSDALSLAAFKPSQVRIATENTLVLTSTDLAADTSLTDLDRAVGNAGLNPSSVAIDGRAIGAITANDGAVTFAPGSLLEVPSGTISVAAAAPVERITQDSYTAAGGMAVPAAGGGIVVLPAGIQAGITVAGDTPDGKGGIIAGAIIDAAGLTDVVLPVESNLITVARVGQNELADSPLQRDGFIYRQRNILVDRRLSGVRDDGFAWVGTPLFDASGYVNARGQLVTERMLTGGSIAFSGAVVTGRNSLLNVAGGLLTYAAGSVATTQLITADGNRTVDIGRADPNVVYSGIAGRFVEDHSKWNVTTTYTGLGLSNAASQFEASYFEGASAGRISFGGVAQSVPQTSNTSQTTTPSIGLGLVALDGRIAGGAVAGPYQRQGSAYASPAPRGATLDLSQVLASTATIAGSGDIAARRKATPAQFLPSDVVGVTVGQGVFLDQYWSVEMLAASGFSDLGFGSAGFARAFQGYDQPIGATTLITLGVDARQLAGAAAFAKSPLLLGDGAALRFTAQAVDIEADIVAHAGAVTVGLVSKRFRDADYLNVPPVTPGNPIYQPTTGSLPRSSFRLGPGVSVDLSGRFVNDLNAVRDSLAGYDFVNGGGLSISTNSILNDVVFAAGSRVDLDSGGYVTAAGRLGTTGSAGLGRGRGGSLSIELTRLARGYVPLDPATDPRLVSGIATADVRERIDSNLVLAGSIDANGFQGGGTFSLITPAIEIGGGVDGVTRGLATLTPDFFTTHGFDGFALTALLTARVDDGVTLALSQQQFQPTAGIATATSLTEGAVLGRYAANTLQRAPVNLSLTARGQTDFNSHAVTAFDASGLFTVIVPTGRSYTADHALTVGAGARIAGDAQARILLSATGQLRLGVDGAGGGITAAGGTIGVTQRFGILTAGFTYGPATIIGSTTIASPSYETGLIADAFEIDAGGVFLGDLRATDRRAGTALNGGTVIIDGGTEDSSGLPAGAIFGRSGSSIDVAGAAGTIDLPTGDLALGFAPTVVASAGGTLRLTGATLNSTLSGGGGDPQTAGATLEIAATRAFQTAGVDIDKLEPLAAPRAAAGGSLLSQGALIADNLIGSGFDALAVRGALTFFDTVAIDLDRSIILTGGALSWRTARSVPAADRALVTLAAPYVRLATDGTRQRIGLPAPGGSAGLVGRADLVLSAGTIDIADQQSTAAFGTTRLNATGDIRFIPQLVTRAPAGASASAISTFYEFNASLIAAGDLTLQAAQIYPATAVSATLGARFKDGLTSSGTNSGTITVLGNAGSATAVAPLSAGGSLTLTAGRILQGGVLRAPLGHIDFAAPGGVVELQPGSVTSVTANGLLIPYGTTSNGTQWFYSALTGAPLTAAPDKAVDIAAGSAALDAGARLDLSGGGDIYATEFIPGLGGQRNVLTSSLSTDASAPVYAILPGQQPLVAPVDPNGYSNLVPDTPGRTLTLLSDAGGLKAGTYLLYAGSYATVPGAFRVQAVPSTTDLASGANSALPDGSVVVAGRLGIAGTAVLASRTAGYRVFDEAAWRQYSQIETTLGGKFFADQAAAAGVVPASLPADAGRLSIAVTSVDKALKAQATLDFSVAVGGRGGQVDIAAGRIAVVSAALQANLAQTLGGYLVLTPQDITGFNAASVLLGATRTTDITGDTLAPIATDIRIATTAVDPLSNPELLFVTTGGTANVANTISVDAGSLVTARGVFAGQPAGTIRFGRSGGTDASGNQLPDQVGDGNVLRLSNGGAVAIVRTAANPDPHGVIAISATAANPARLDGGQALQLDASRDLRIDGDAVLSAAAVELHGRQIRFADGASAGDAVIGSASLAALNASRSLTLRADERLVFDRDTALGSSASTRLVLDAPVVVSNGAAVSLAAASIILGNSGVLADETSATAGTGDLVATATTLVLNGGDRVFQGFDSFTFNASRTVSVGDGKAKGTLVLPGDVRIVTPLLTLAEGSDQTLRIGGDFSALRTATGAAAATSAIGGRLAVDADGAVVITDTVSATAGVLDVRARGGNLTIDSGALISAHGYTQSFADKQVVLAAGRVSLTADTGVVRVAAGGEVDVAADAQGNAGVLALTVGGGGTFELTGTLSGTSGGGATLGGQFDLYAGGAVVLDPLARSLATGGFTGSIAVRSGLGNLELTTTSLTARKIALTADDRSAGNGFVNVATTLDASGPEGGAINLYGQRGVNVAATAVLRAVATEAATEDRGGRGGTVSIGTGVLSPDSEVQSAGGSIVLAAGSRIDVSDALVNGASSYGANRGSGGATVAIRAPIVAGDVAVTLGATITGARTVSLEAYRRFTTGNSAFDGIIDPAGWFNGDGSRVAGTWTDPYGGIVLPGLNQTGTGALTEASYFSPVTYDPVTGAATNHANQAHVGFYQQTLVQFARNPGIDPTRFAGVEGLHVQPGIELVNSDLGINFGNIAVLSNWNLGAGTAADALIYRTAAGAEPGILTLRAVGEIIVKASISDGFFRTTRYNPYSGFDYTDARLVRDTYSSQSGAYRFPIPPKFPIRFGQKIGDVPTLEAAEYYRNFEYYADRLYAAWDDVVIGTGVPNVPNRVGVVPFPAGFAAPETNYAAYAGAYRKYLDETVDAYNEQQALRGDKARYRRPVPPADAPDEATYPTYAALYFDFLAKIVDYNNRYSGIGQALTASPNQPSEPPGVINTAAVAAFNAPVANTIANNATAGDPVPLTSSDLMAAGASWSYRLVAGSNTASADPTRLRAAADVVLPADVTIGDAALTAATATGSGVLLRTGTGSISVTTAGDVRWVNGNDGIYTAGIDAGYVGGFVDRSKVQRREFILADGNNSSVTNMEVADGAAQTPGVFGRRGGDVTIRARGDLIGAAERGLTLTGFRDPVFANNPDGYDGQSGPLGYLGLNFYTVSSGARRTVADWLVEQGVSSDQPALFGQFGGTSARAQAVGGPITVASLQSAEWVRTGRFTGTVATLGGGNVDLDAGGDISDVSVSVVSTFQAAGGKAPGEGVTVTHFGGGDLLMHAGGDITGATVLLGRGNGRIVADGAMPTVIVPTRQFDEEQFLANAAITDFREPIPADLRAASEVPALAPVSNSLTVENGTLSVSARGDVSLAAMNQSVPRDTSLDELDFGGGTGQLILPQTAPFSQFGTTSAVDVRSAAGNVAYARPLAGISGTDRGSITLLAPTLTLAAIRGDLAINGSLELAPSPTGNLDLLAGGSVIYAYRQVYSDTVPLGSVDPAAGPVIRMGDQSQDQIATAAHPVSGSGTPAADRFTSHAATPQPLHFGDSEISHIVALSGDVVTGAGLATDPVAGIAVGAITSISLAESATVRAGRDIVDMRFTGQNTSADSITSIIAGRDVTFTVIPSFAASGAIASQPAGGTYTVGGPGTLALIAGRNLNLAPALGTRRVLSVVNGNNVLVTRPAASQGLLAVGNDLNPYLSQTSAELQVLFGAGPTVAQPGSAGIGAFVARYIDPASAATLPTDYGQLLLDYVNARLIKAAQELDPTTGYAGIPSRPPADRPDPAKPDPVAVAAAYDVFKQLPADQQRSLVDKVFFSELRAISQTTDLAQYLNYPRAYTAIDTLFPGAAGYTDNFSIYNPTGQPLFNASGNPLALAAPDTEGNQANPAGLAVFDSAGTPVLPRLTRSGSLNMVDSLLQTSYGSGIDVLGPGGSAVFGGLNVTSSFASQGVLTLRGGAINIFTDGSVNVNNSRIFTLQGGDETIFATNGNIDAGRGRRTAGFLPPLVVSYLPTTGALVNFGGLVSGAGIGTLQTLPGGALADIFLLAPRGDIDAGDAGIRSSGNLNVVANQIIGADNITAAGTTTGVPQAPSISATAVAAASNTSAAAGETQTAAAQRPLDQQAVITVQVTGCSDDDLAKGRCAKP